MGRDMATASRVDAVLERVTRLVETGLLKPGERVASIRGAAAEMGVSKNTVADAYDRLVATGLLQARPGSGYVVSACAGTVLPQSRPHVAEALDVVSLLREQLDRSYAVRPGDGRPPTAWMEGAELGAQFARARLARDGEVEYGYGSSWGYLKLRERIAVTLAERSVACGPDQVLLTHGANHALDLITRHLVEPRDAVFVDDPGYYPLFGKLRLLKAEIIGIRRLPDGPDLQDLEAKLATVRPKAFFTQSLAHNPTGGSISLPKAHGLLQLAERHGFLLVEDDPFADLLPAALPRLAALDQLNRVLYVGTFSKTLSASLRVGFVAAHPAMAAALADLKLLTGVATSGHMERFVVGLIADGHYLRHMRRLRTQLGNVTRSAVADLAAIGLPVAPPRDIGFYLWVQLPAGLEETALCRDAAAQSIFLAPGQVFSPGRRSLVPALRINVAYASDPRFLSFMRGQLGPQTGAWTEIDAVSGGNSPGPYR